MYVDTFLYPVTALGPGKRVVLWVAGCHRQCPYCANPDLWHRHEYQKITPQKAAAYIESLKEKEVEGLTITGGEPFDQAEELAEMILSLSFKVPVQIFTGYKLEDLMETVEAQKLLKLTDVLIDGEYIDELNDSKSPLRGSVNQRIHYLNPSLEEVYEEYMKQGRQIQNFVYDYRTISVGIHNRQEDKR